MLTARLARCVRRIVQGSGRGPRLGDNVEDPEEGCAYGNQVTESCAHNVKPLNRARWQCDCTERGAVRVCGDNVEAEEGCDDGNQVTSCAYGEAECTVCAADCTEQVGAVRVCGDACRPEEQCDAGANVDLNCPENIGLAAL